MIVVQKSLSLKKFSKFLSICSIIILPYIFTTTTTARAEIQGGFGFGFSDESDDRRRPTFIGSLDTPTVSGRLYYFGRKSNLVSESSLTIAALQQMKIPSGPSYLSAGYGLTLLQDTTSINASDGTNTVRESDSNYNIGVLLGLYAEKELGKVSLKASWEQHIYPAGIYASLFLVTGKRQVISAVVSYDL